jgi:hypothetical protein
MWFHTLLYGWKRRTSGTAEGHDGNYNINIANYQYSKRKVDALKLLRWTSHRSRGPGPSVSSDSDRSQFIVKISSRKRATMKWRYVQKMHRCLLSKGPIPTLCNGDLHMTGTNWCFAQYLRSASCQQLQTFLDNISQNINGSKARAPVVISLCCIEVGFMRSLLYLSSRYKLDLSAFKNPDNRSDVWESLKSRSTLP